MSDLNGFDAKAKDLIELLLDYEWTGRRTSKGHWLGKAPDGKTTITIPSKMDNPSRAEKNARATFKKWVRESMPDIAEAMDAAQEETDPIIQQTLKGKAERMVTEQNVKQIASAMQRDFEAMLEGWPKRRPWMAHKASNVKGGVRYESEAVIEVESIDGTLTYECAFTGCEYTNPNPRGVAVHYGKAHTMKGEVEPASQDGPKIIDPTYTEPLFERDYNPTARLVDALVDVLAKLNGHGTDREKAVEILRWFRLRPDIEHTTRESEPMTDADILLKIRRLVGQPDLSAELEQVKAERDEALAQLAKVSRDLDGIRELMGEVGR